MEAIILAGGKGTRLQSVVNTVPKPMAPINGKPFLEILISNLVNNGFTRVILSVGYMADVIIEHFGNHYQGIEIDYAIETHPLDTGGAIRYSLSKVKSDYAYIFNGDTFVEIDFEYANAFWEQHKRPTIIACKIEDTTRFGRIITADNLLQGFKEKGESGPGIINAGCYILPKNSLDRWDLCDKFSIENDFLIPNASQNNIMVIESKGKFIDIGIPEDYIIAGAFFKKLR